MSKKYLLEQCKRLQFITNDENEFSFGDETDEWWLNHNKGHEYICNEFITFIQSKKIFTKKEAIKWLNGKIKKSNGIIKRLDKKYNFFIQDEEMTPEDNFSYSFNDGLICQASTLRNIVYRKRYLSKDSYEPTDWKAY